MYQKKVQLGVYHTQIQPTDHDIVAISGQWQDIMAVGMASDDLIGYCIAKKLIILSLGDSRTSMAVDGVTWLCSCVETILRIL